MSRRRIIEFSVATAAVALAVLLAALGFATFRGARPSSLPSAIVADRLTLGFIRIAVIVLCCYAIASVPALAVSGRWMRSIGPSGVMADDVDRAVEDRRELISYVEGSLPLLETRIALIEEDLDG